MSDFIEIHSEVFDKDFDEVNYDGTCIDDSDKESEEEYGIV